MASIQTQQEYCAITFVYSDEVDSKTVVKPLLRFIPVDELHECYFVVCRDDRCPNLRKYHVHPKGMKGCPGYRNWGVCRAQSCSLNKWHLYGSHKKCVGSKKARGYNKHNPIPFANDHTVNEIPDGEKVYHFNAWRFDDHRKHEKCCCCGKSGAGDQMESVTDFDLPRNNPRHKQPICRECHKLEVCSLCNGWGQTPCRGCRQMENW